MITTDEDDAVAANATAISNSGRAAERRRTTWRVMTSARNFHVHPDAVAALSDAVADPGLDVVVPRKTRASDSEPSPSPARWHGIQEHHEPAVRGKERRRREHRGVDQPRVVE